MFVCVQCASQHICTAHENSVYFAPHAKCEDLQSACINTKYVCFALFHDFSSAIHLNEQKLRIPGDNNQIDARTSEYGEQEVLMPIKPIRNYHEAKHFIPNAVLTQIHISEKVLRNKNGICKPLFSTRNFLLHFNKMH